MIRILGALIPHDAIAIPSLLPLAVTVFAVVLGCRIAIRDVAGPDVRIMSTRSVALVDISRWLEAVENVDDRETTGTTIARTMKMDKLEKDPFSIAYFADDRNERILMVSRTEPQVFEPTAEFRQIVLAFGLPFQVKMNASSLQQAFVAAGMENHSFNSTQDVSIQEPNPVALIEIANEVFGALEPVRAYSYFRRIIEIRVIESLPDEARRLDATIALTEHRRYIIGLMIQSGEDYPVMDARLELAASANRPISLWSELGKMESGTRWTLATLHRDSPQYFIAICDAPMSATSFVLRAPRYQPGLRDVFDIWALLITIGLIAVYALTWYLLHGRRYDSPSKVQEPV